MLVRASANRLQDAESTHTDIIPVVSSDGAPRDGSTRATRTQRARSGKSVIRPLREVACCRCLIQHQSGHLQSQSAPPLSLICEPNVARAPRQPAFGLDVRDPSRNEYQGDLRSDNLFEFRRCCETAPWQTACLGKRQDCSLIRSERFTRFHLT